MENKLYLEQVFRAGTRITLGAGMGAILLYGAFFVERAQAYNPFSTHAPLAERSVQLFNRENSTHTLTDEEKHWVIEGARDEDNPATRVVNHFYDPVNNAGLSGFASSKQWAHNAGAQQLNRFGGRDMTWEAAVRAYESGDKESAYRALGHLLHLIQDATVPAHARQDPHLHIEFGTIVLDGYGGKDPYEKLSEPLSTPSISELKIPQLSSFNSYLDATAKYTNSGFLSMDSVGFYAKPIIIRLDNSYIYSEDELGEYKLIRVTEKIPTRLFTIPPKLKSDNFNDPLVISDYWSRLAPVAIKNGAGVIQLFKNTVKEPQQIPESGLGATISSLFESSKKIAAGIVARTQSSWEMVQFGWNQHAVDLASISFALQTNNIPSISTQTYQSQREDAARKVFLAQLQNATPTTTAPQQRTTPNSVQETTPESELPTPPQEETTGGEKAHVARIIDGDTIELSDGRHIRYIGIDAPEVGHGDKEGGCFADEATKRNTQLVLNKDIRMTTGPDDIDAYGRLLRFVWVGITFVNQSLIETGHAYAFDFGHPHEYSGLFATRQQIARDNQLGLWGPLCQENLEEELLPEKIPLAKKARLLINEVRMQEYEFIEIFNPTDQDAPLSGYFISYYASTRTQWNDPSWRRLLPTDSIVPAHGFYIISFGPKELIDGTSNWHPYQTERLAQTIGTVALFANDPKSDSGILIDALGWGTVRLSEGTSFRNIPTTHGSVARPNTNSSVLDRNNNVYDFQLTYIPTPGALNEIFAPTAPRPENDIETPIENSNEETPVENVFITEIQVGGVTATDEFIEIYNGNATDISIVAWSLKKKTQTGTESNLISSQEFLGTIPAGKHFLIVPQTLEEGSPPYTGATTADTTYSGASYSIAANNTVLLYDMNKNLLDKVGYGTATDFEGTAAAPGPPNGQSIARLITQEGFYQDTDENSSDFSIAVTPTPQNIMDSIVIPEEEPWQTPLSSADIRYPAVDSSENIYFTEGSGIASYNSEGNQRWLTTAVTAYEGATLSLDGTKLYTAGCGGPPETPECYFATITTATGNISNVTQIDTAAWNGGPTQPILDGDGNVYVAVTGFTAGSIWKFSPAGEIFDTDNPTPIWPLSWESIDWTSLGVAEPRNYIERIQRIAITNDVLLIAAQPLSNQHYLFAFDKNTGTFLWQINMEQDNINRTLGVTATDELAFYTAYKTSSNQAGIAAYSTTDGTLLWHEPFEETITWLYSLEINTASGFAYTVPTPNYGKLYRSSLGAGTTIKLFEDIGGAEISTPLVSDSTNLYFATEDGIARALRISDSEIVWEYDTGYELQHVIPTETFIYGITETGELVMIER